MSYIRYLATVHLNSQRMSLISEPSRLKPEENHHFSSVLICLQRTLTMKIFFRKQIFAYPFLHAALLSAIGLFRRIWKVKVHQHHTEKKLLKYLSIIYFKSVTAKECTNVTTRK